MLSLKDRYFLTKSTIESSDLYDEFPDLFDEGIGILNKQIEEENYSEFDEDEREVLEEIFIHINYEDE